MHTPFRLAVLPVLLLALSAAGFPVSAQTRVTVPPDTTPPQPAAVQPSLPGSAQASPPKPGSPVVEKIVKERQPILDVRRTASRRSMPRHHHVARRIHGRSGYGLAPIDRPALAGVELVAPLPPPGEPPHIVVPTPAYPVEAVLAGITTPPPPIVCHHTRRDPYAPDPHLYREQPVECIPDNP